MILLTNIRKCFGTTEALVGISFTIRPGEFAAQASGTIHALGMASHSGAALFSVRLATWVPASEAPLVC